MKSMIEKYGEIINDIYRIIHDKSLSLKANTDQVLISLFARIMCGADTIIDLLKAENHTFIPAVLRSMEEAWVDLNNLQRDANYIHIMHFLFADQERNFLEHYENNPKTKEYFEDGSNAKKRLEAAILYTDKWRRLKKKASVKRRFIRAGLTEEYYTTYGELCRCTHNNLDKLVADHMHDDLTSFYAHSKLEKSELVELLKLSIKVCLTSSKLTAHLFGLKRSNFSSTDILAAKFPN